MTVLFKYLVFSFAVSAVFGFTSVRDDANWFKNGDRIKNRFVTGVVNGIVDFDCVDYQNGASVEGECLSKVECTKSGGKIGGLCSFLGSCCVTEKTCDGTTASKVSYFVPPKTFQKRCPLTINIYSKDVCQIRLDFEEFDIAKPTSEEIENGKRHSYRCRHDKFMVPDAMKDLGFAYLCGRNKGQHIYIPIGEKRQRITLLFEFDDERANLKQPNWRIKIRQLECSKSGNEHLVNAPSKLMAMYNSLKSKKNPKSDRELIAPANCLQYYYNASGTFESFNYDGGAGVYIGPLHYAICFKQSPEICGARFKADGIFQMNSNDDTFNDTDRCHPKEFASFFVSQDYIQIQGGFLPGKTYQDYFCNKDFQDGQTVVTKSNEPLFVGVHTDEFVAKNENANVTENVEVGFKIRYDLETGRCNIPY